jgi:hypothetical protein
MAGRRDVAGEAVVSRKIRKTLDGGGMFRVVPYFAEPTGSASIDALSRHAQGEQQ